MHGGSERLHPVQASEKELGDEEQALRMAEERGLYYSILRPLTRLTGRSIVPYSRREE